MIEPPTRSFPSSLWSLLSLWNQSLFTFTSLYLVIQLSTESPRLISEKGFEIPSLTPSDTTASICHRFCTTLCDMSVVSALSYSFYSCMMCHCLMTIKPLNSKYRWYHPVRRSHARVLYLWSALEGQFHSTQQQPKDIVVTQYLWDLCWEVWGGGLAVPYCPIYISLGWIDGLDDRQSCCYGCVMLYLMSIAIICCFHCIPSYSVLYSSVFMMLPPTVVHCTIYVTTDWLSNVWADMLLLRCHSIPCYTMLGLILYFFLLFTIILSLTASVPALCSGD